MSQTERAFTALFNIEERRRKNGENISESKLRSFALLKSKVLEITKKAKSVPLHATEALGGRGDIAPTYSRPRQ
jgi:hypothetical protein